jgi:hypothetical protein
MLLLLGCQDYGLVEQKGEPPEGGADTAFFPDTGSDVTAHADLGYSAMWQRHDWGQESPTCTFSLAFHAPDDPEPEPSSGQRIEYPTEPGTCVYTAFDETANTPSAPLSDYGSLDAGTVELSDEEGALPLTRRDDAEGYKYTYTDCDAWPFGRAFDLVVAEPPGGLPPLHARALVPLSPHIEGEPPAALDAAGYLRHTAGTDLRLDWSVGDTPPVGAPRTLLLLRHFRGSEAVLFEALACMPTEAGTITVPADTLAAFTVDTEGGDTWIAAQVDAAWYADEEDTSWGDIRRAWSVTTWGGEMLVLGP